MVHKFTEQFGLYGIVTTIVVIFIISQFINLSEAKEAVVAAGVFAPLAFILLKILTIVIAPISGSPLYPLVGLFFGFWPGLLYVALGDYLGYTIAFFISRIFGRDRVERYMLHGEHGRLALLVNTMSTAKGFFQACLVGFPLPEILSYAAGLSRLSYWKFILILWPASIIVTGALVFLGANIVELGRLSYVIPLAGLACMVVGGFFLARKFKESK